MFSISTTNSLGTLAISSLSLLTLYLQANPSTLTEFKTRSSPSKTKGAFKSSVKRLYLTTDLTKVLSSSNSKVKSMWDAVNKGAL